jgi:DNA-binding transcriptional regulator YiaG
MTGTIGDRGITVEPIPTPEQTRAIRRRLGISQQAAADWLRVHRVTWNKWERGTLIPMQQSAFMLRLLSEGRLPRD